MRLFKLVKGTEAEAMGRLEAVRDSIGKGEVEFDQFSIKTQYTAIRVEGRTVGIVEKDRIFLLGDRVEIRADARGFISPDNLQEGVGTIEKIRINGNVRFGVRMDSGEFGYVTTYYIWKVIE